jgi:aspartate/tyrosine/aromatic aminotransferase
MINYIMPNIVMSDELSFESEKEYKLISQRLELMRKNLAEIKRKRNIDQLKEISKYGLY